MVTVLTMTVGQGDSINHDRMDMVTVFTLTAGHGVLTSVTTFEKLMPSRLRGCMKLSDLTIRSSLNIDLNI
jgi:hypothetical protein